MGQVRSTRVRIGNRASSSCCLCFGAEKKTTTSASPRSEKTSGICGNFNCLCPYPSRFRAMVMSHAYCFYVREGKRINYGATHGTPRQSRIRWVHFEVQLLAVQYAEFGTTCARKLFFPPKACAHRSKRKLQNPSMIAATCTWNTYTSTTTSTSGCINSCTTTSTTHLD
jgi:hypothetical protein